MGYVRALLACALSMVLGAAATAALTVPATAGSPTEYDPTCPPAATPPPESDPIRIMLAGDSITNGTSGDYTWRYFFHQRLIASGERVDLVGPWSDVADNTTYEWGQHDYADCGFDQDHFARGGAKLAEQLEPAPFGQPGESKIQWATAHYEPDLVVAFYGYNDLSQPRVRGDATSLPYSVAELLANAKSFIDEVREAAPTTTIMMVNLAVAEIPDASPGNQRLVALAPAYNAELAEKVALWTTEESKVVLGDAAQYWRGLVDTHDGAHPTAQGEVDLAAGIARSVSEQLGVGDAPALPLPVMPSGPRVAPVLAGSVGDGWVRLSWRPVPGATRMLVYCRGAGSVDWNQLPDVDRTISEVGNSVVLRTCKTATPPAKDPSLTDGRTYQFQIRAAKGTSVATDITSNVVALTQPGTPPLARVANLVVTPSFHALKLSWNAVAGAGDYVVGWRKSGSTTYSHAPAATTVRSITGLVAGQTYEVRVKARSAGNDGPYAAPVAATPGGVVCAAPIRPTLVRVPEHRVRVYWKTVPGATRYEVQYRSATGSWKRAGWAVGTVLTSPDLVPGATYAFRVRAWHQRVPGGISPERTIRAG